MGGPAMLRFSGAFVLLFLFVGCEGRPAPLPADVADESTASTHFEKIREPAVAGIFYPRHESTLRQTVDRLLADAKKTPEAKRVHNLRALVCPHAGYEFSGPTAAVAYNQLLGRDFSTVILMGPSHYAAYTEAFVSTVDAWQTPLGPIPVSPKAVELAKNDPFTAGTQYEIHRPAWWRQSPKELPPFGQDTPETWEHSVEVQLPFLQQALPKASIIPVIFGEVDPQKAADRLLPFLDDHTLIIVSTDLSHYHPYAEAKALDKRCVKAVCDLQADDLTGDDACGHGPLQTLIQIAKKKGWKTRLLDYRNSGDTSGDRSAVVGYAAIAFYDPSETKTSASPKDIAPYYTNSERRFLLELARQSVTAAATDGPSPDEHARVSDKLRERRACFVTLTKSGALRGCIGSIFPEESLYQAVIRRARSAAVEDPRFPPVRADELKQLDIEISVLTIPRPLNFTSPQDLLAKLRPHIDGVVLHVGLHQATFLPQVWESLTDKREFLGELSEKAGLAASAWMDPSAKVLTYQVEAFKEAEKVKSKTDRPSAQNDKR